MSETNVSNNCVNVTGTQIESLSPGRWPVVELRMAICHPEIVHNPEAEKKVGYRDKPIIECWIRNELNRRRDSDNK